MRDAVTGRCTHLLEPETPDAPGRSLRVVRLSGIGLVGGHTDDGRACLLGLIDQPQCQPGPELLEVLLLLDGRGAR